MNKLSLLLLLSLAFENTFSQDLNTRWREVDSLFKIKNDREVVIRIQPLINELDRLNLKKELIVLYYTFAVSTFRTGQRSLSDSIFFIAQNLSKKLQLEQNLKEILITQINLNLDLARISKEKDNTLSISCLQKALAISTELDDEKMKLSIQLELAYALKGNGDFIGAISTLEKFIDVADMDNKNFVNAVNLVNELYMEVGDYNKLLNLAGNELKFTQLIYAAVAKKEVRSDYRSALNLLNVIRVQILHSAAIDDAIEFAKKRFELFYKMDVLDSSIASLESDLLILRNREKKHNYKLLSLEKLLVISLLKNSNIKQAFDVITFLKLRIDENMVDESFLPHYFQLRGDVSYLVGDFAEAIKFYENAFRSTNNFNQDELFSIKNNLGLAYLKSGNHSESLKLFNQLASIVVDEEKMSFKIHAYLNEGLVYMKSENFKSALNSFKNAKALATTYKIQVLRMFSSLRMAEVYQMQGFESVARETFNEILQSYDSVTDINHKIQLMMAIASYKKNNRMYNEAKYFISEVIKISAEHNLSVTQRYAYSQLAEIFLLTDNPDSALIYFERFKERRSYITNRRENLLLDLKIAKCHYAVANFESSQKILSNLLDSLFVTDKKDIFTITPDDVHDIYLFNILLTELAAVHYSLGVTTNDLEKVFFSFKEIKKTIQLIEASYLTHLLEQKMNIGTETYIESYRLFIDIAIDLYSRTNNKDFLTSAFDISEKFRSQSFINEVGTNLLSRLKDTSFSKTSEISKYFDNKDKYSPIEVSPDKEMYLNESLTRGLKITKDTSKSFTLIQSKYDELIDELKNNNSKVADLISVTSLTPQTIIELLKENEIILNYFVSKEKIYLFVISRNHFEVKHIQLSELELRDKIQHLRIQLQEPKNSSFLVSSQNLYKLFIGSVEGLLEQKKILIVPSGQLHNIPFSALHDGEKYLGEKNEIMVLPNISSLQLFSRNKILDRASHILAIGNPSTTQLTPLPGAETEVLALKDYFVNSLILTREKASEARVKKEISQFNIIHFACHGLFNYDYPLLSALALASDDETDGRLELHELYNLNLTNTKLVVLSACETALSQIKRNDEMIGLVRGFLYAGASNVIASLWKVDDAATASLMKNFYLFMTQGYSVASSLQKAQMELLHSSEFGHPFYWAAFVLNGIE